MDTVTDAVCADNGLIESLLSTLRNRIGPQKYNAWFRHGAKLRLETDCLRIDVPNPFVANWIETHYQGEIGEILNELAGQAYPITIGVDAALSGELRRNDLDSQADLVAKSTEGRARRRKPVAATPLRHRLEDFVVGDSNKLAFTATMTVAGGAKPPFNPLFVHGPCGVGKTHLLQGACNQFLQAANVRGGRCRYVTGEQFTNEFIQAVRNKTFDEFRRRYRNLDLLAIDDIHFLAAKKATQDEFLHTFNAIESAGKQIILASDTHPNLVSKLNPQLLSRFVAGMVVKVDSPDRETRMAILRRKAASLKLSVGDDVLVYIAMHIRGSVRELEGALVKLAAVAALEDTSPSPELARSALADYLAQTDSALALGDIEMMVAAYFGVTPADIHSSRRTRAVSVARMAAMYLARKHTTMSFPEIGRAMGKNHSSVVLAVQRMEAHLAEGADVTWPTLSGPRTMAAHELINLLDSELT
ncbi:MAG: chromosomal replication initiator protein DnaA [Planctomycetota bacterium]|jgi:chromosomal replication initiator protein